MPVRTLHVFVDAGRVEEALLQASEREPFVDATGYWTLTQLIEACAPAGPQGLDRLTARYLVARLVRDQVDNPFGTWGKDIGFARAAVDLFGELELQLASPEQLERAAAQVGSARAAWLGRLWRGFREAKTRLSLAEPIDQLRSATAALMRGVPSGLTSFDRVELEGFHDLPPALLALVTALDHALPSVGLTLPRADAPAIDALVNHLHAELERNHQTSRLDLKGDIPDAPFAALPLFSDASEPRHWPGLQGFCAETPRQEAQHIARQVRSQLDSGAAPEDVAVVFRDLPADVDVLLEAFAEMGVPAKARYAKALASLPAAHVALALPAMADDGFPAAAVARCLSSRYLANVYDAGSDPAAFFKAAGIRDDRVGAQNDRGAYALRLEALATRFSEGHPRGPAAEVRAVARNVDTLFEAVDALKPEATLIEFLRGFGRALERLGLIDALRAPALPNAVKSAERALARDQAAADGLVALLRSAQAAAQRADLTELSLSRREFGRWLHDAAGEIRCLVPGPRVGAVSVIEAREVHGRSFQHVYLAGLVDGAFPKRQAGGGLISDEEKGALNAAGGAPLFRLSVGEAGERLSLPLATDRLHFYLSLCAARDSVTLSFSRREGLGRVLSPSPFVGEVKRAAPGFEVVRLPHGVLPAPDLISCERELRLFTMLSRAPSDEPWAKQALWLADIEDERLRFFSDPEAKAGAHTGAVDAALLGEAFAFDARRPLTAARLGVYGNCAFSGFLSDVLGLRPLEAQSEDLDQRSRGTLMHRVLEMLLPVLRGPLPANLDDVIGLAVEEAAAQHQRRAPVGHPLLWQLARQRAHAELAALLKSDRVRPFSGLVPEKAEWKFSVELPGLAVLEGKVDRVDVGANAAAVIDYKTGRVEGRADHIQRLFVSEWQLPLYALAVRAAGLAQQVDGALVSTREGVRSLSDFARDMGVSVNELLSTDEWVRARLDKEGRPNLTTEVSKLVSRLRAGELQARPHDCERCSHRPVCRISARRLHEEPR